MIGSLHPHWPLPRAPKPWTAGGSFGARRPSSKTFTRHHQGVDLYAPAGEAVLACEDGVIVAHQGWDGPNAKAILVESNGCLILYGAVAPGSYGPVGTVVRRGEQIAKIGVYPAGSTMLHIELWLPGVRPPRPRWEAGDDAPMQLQDIELYLKRAMTPAADHPSESSDDGASGLFGLFFAGLGLLGFLKGRKKKS
jgi:murein DD-endopeptidase MepM/ murein hydrolase activator NlpD